MLYHSKTDFFNNKQIARKFSITFTLIGIIGIIFLDKFLSTLFDNDDLLKQAPLVFGIIFILVTGLMLYFVMNQMQKKIAQIKKSYDKLKQQDKDRLMPYEFALDNSVDQIYWFTLDAKFVYVNQAACTKLGYTKDEMLNMDLEEMDTNFTRESAKDIMKEIKNTKNWRLETTQQKKDGTIVPIEVSGHSFNYAGCDYICAFGRDISGRINARNKITKINTQLQKSIDEKEILLKEIHHRVKNNMEIISSLLNMQARRSNDNALIDAMKQSRSRIHTMALVHEFLYLGDNLAYINLSFYIKKLVDDIKDLYLSQNTHLNVDLHLDNLVFSTNRSIQVGMVLHELCVNALKYAFQEDRDNLLCIHIKEKDGNIYLKIRDNGEGLDDIQNLYKKDSIGMQLINSIVEDQLDGTILFVNNNGLECNIIFPVEEEL